MPTVMPAMRGELFALNPRKWLTMSFLLYRRPGRLVFLDDDRDYLEMLGEVMPPDWCVGLFLRPVACIESLRRDIQARETDAWTQQAIIKRWHDGAPLIPEILQYWRDDGAARFAFTQVAVVDYAMPAMSGLRVLDALTRWPGARILLTGRADEELAVSAFNRGLIDQFIPKQSPDIRRRLTDAILYLQHQPDARHQQLWSATLAHGQHALLCDPLIAKELAGLARRHGWIEHVAIGAPFGVLALDAQGAVSWLQLERSEDLPALADAALSQGWNASTAQGVRDGNTLIDLALRVALGAEHQSQPSESFALTGERGVLHGALFSIGAPFSPGLASSHQRYLADHGERRPLEH